MKGDYHVENFVSCYSRILDRWLVARVAAC